MIYGIYIIYDIWYIIVLWYNKYDNSSWQLFELVILMYYQPLTTSFTSFTRYSDRYKDVLDRALQDKNTNQAISIPFSFEK